MTTGPRTLANRVLLAAGVGLACLAAGCTSPPPRTLPSDPMYGYRPTYWHTWQEACVAQRAQDMPPAIQRSLPGQPSQAASGGPMPPPLRPAVEWIPTPMNQSAQYRPQPEPALDPRNNFSRPPASEGVPLPMSQPTENGPQPGPAFDPPNNPSGPPAGEAGPVPPGQPAENGRQSGPAFDPPNNPSGPPAGEAGPVPPGRPAEDGRQSGPVPDPGISPWMEASGWTQPGWEGSWSGTDLTSESREDRLFNPPSEGFFVLHDFLP